jgi:hypothetical protein
MGADRPTGRFEASPARTLEAKQMLEGGLGELGVECV